MKQEAGFALLEVLIGGALLACCFTAATLIMSGMSSTRAHVISQRNVELTVDNIATDVTALSRFDSDAARALRAGALPTSFSLDASAMNSRSDLTCLAAIIPGGQVILRITCSDQYEHASAYREIVLTASEPAPGTLVTPPPTPTEGG